MYVAPRTRLGRWSLVLLLVVLLYPLYWSVFRLVPWRPVSIGVALLVPALALVSVVLAALAILRGHDRSVLLLVVAVLTAALVVAFGVGEVLAPH